MDEGSSANQDPDAKETLPGGEEEAIGGKNPTLTQR